MAHLGNLLTKQEDLEDLEENLILTGLAVNLLLPEMRDMPGREDLFI